MASIAIMLAAITEQSSNLISYNFVLQSVSPCLPQVHTVPVTFNGFPRGCDVKQDQSEGKLDGPKTICPLPRCSELSSHHRKLMGNA